MSAVEDYSKMVVAIIQGQETVIGPVALDQARQVKGLEIDWDSKSVTLKQEPKQIIDSLVAQYKSLFGKISVEVCKEAVGRLAQHLSSDQIPASLR